MKKSLAVGAWSWALELFYKYIYNSFLSFFLLVRSYLCMIYLDKYLRATEKVASCQAPLTPQYVLSLTSALTNPTMSVLKLLPKQTTH